MNALMNPFVTASTKAAASLLVWSWQAAVLITCVWAGLKIFRAQSPTLRHQIWLLTLIAVIAMPALSSVTQYIPTPRLNNRALSYATELPRIVIANDASPLVQNQSPAVSARTSIKQPIILSLSFALWIVGVCVIAARASINCARARRLRDRARCVSLTDLDCAEGDCEALRYRKVGLALSDEIRSPILLGVFRPMILLPADIVAWSTLEERRAMLRHELAHVERRDHYVNLFQSLLGVVFFFHPLVRLACRQLTMEREMACDDRVVASGAKAEAYAESLIKVAERSLALAGAPGGVHQLALFSTRQILERRIEMIMNKDRVRVIARQWRYLILPVALIVALLWALLPARSAKPGLAQQVASGDLKDLVAKSLGDSKNSALQNQLNELSQDPPAPPLPPPPPPPPTEEMTVEADKPLTTPRWSQDRDSVFALLREAVDANMRHDAAFFERVLDEYFIETGPDGATINKQQAIADVKRFDHAFKKFEFNDLNVSGNEQMAFATFLGTVYFMENGQESTAQYRYTVNFIKRDGQLKIAAVHLTRKL